jgi:hypothetical protein
MHKTVVILILSFIFLSCCKPTKEKHLDVESNYISDFNEIVVEENEIPNIKETKENIFELLFMDILANYKEYENRIGYEIVIEHYTDIHYVPAPPETVITVKHECYSVEYYPSYYEPDYYEKYGGDREIFIPQRVDIFKKTNECILGEYIGENIEILFQKYYNEIEDAYCYDTPDYKFYSYGYQWLMNSTSSRGIFIGIKVVNNIITNIYYYYEI